MRYLVAAVVLLLASMPALGAKGDKLKKPEPKQEAPVCAPIAPLMDKLKASGLEHQVITDGIAVIKIATVLNANADKPFPMPTSLVIVFLGENAKIGILVGDKLCAVVTGPASSVRGLLKAVHGISIRSVI